MASLSQGPSGLAQPPFGASLRHKRLARAQMGWTGRASQSSAAAMLRSHHLTEPMSVLGGPSSHASRVCVRSQPGAASQFDVDAPRANSPEEPPQLEGLGPRDDEVGAAFCLLACLPVRGDGAGCGRWTQPPIQWSA
jgi:hypothetical protein